MHRHVIDIAWQLFLKNGFDRVTMNDIAAAGRLSKRTIYSRFENKETLFAAAYQHYVDEAAANLSLTDTSMPFETWLRIFAERILRFIASDEVRFIEGRGIPDPNLFPEVSEQTERIYTIVVMNLEDAFARSAVQSAIVVDDPEIALRCWLDMLIGHVRIRHRGQPGGFDIESYLDEWLDTLVEMCHRLLKW